METDTQIKQLCDQYCMSQAEFGRRFCVPYRTVQNWYSGYRVPADYVVNMVRTILRYDLQMAPYLETDKPALKQICIDYDITCAELIRNTGIPLRTAQDQYRGIAKPPVYLVMMIRAVLSAGATLSNQT